MRIRGAARTIALLVTVVLLFGLCATFISCKDDTPPTEEEGGPPPVSKADMEKGMKMMMDTKAQKGGGQGKGGCGQ